MFLSLNAGVRVNPGTGYGVVLLGTLTFDAHESERAEKFVMLND